MLIIAVCVVIFTATCLANPVSDDEYFRKYISDIQSQIDQTVKPCEDFGKYACGNLNIQETESITKNTEIVKLVEKYMMDHKPEKEGEKIIKNFYLSCKNSQDISKILEQIDALKSLPVWPVNRDFNDEEIAELLGFLTTLELVGLLTINTREFVRDESIILSIRGSVGDKDMASLLKTFGVSAEEIIKTVERIKKFSQQIASIQYLDNKSSIYDEFTDVAALKKAVPNFDWDTFFTTFTNVYTINMDNFVKTPVKTRDLEKLKKIVDLIKETDSRTVVDYIVSQFLIQIDKVDCELPVLHLFPLLALRFLNNQLRNPETLFLNELNVINNFQKSLSEINSQLNNPRTTKTMNESVSLRKKIYKNYKMLLSGEYLTDFFSNFEMKEDSFASNMVNIIHTMNKSVMYGAKINFKYFSDTLKSFIISYEENEGKPLVYNFITETTDLWTTAMLLDDIYENRTISENCFPYEDEIENSKNTDYLNDHAGYHVALHDYLNYVDENKDEFKKHTEILTESGLDNAKMYMLSMAQKICSANKKKNLDDDNFLWYLKHSKDFSKTWSCSAGDLMNVVCDDSTFVPHFKNSL